MDENVAQATGLSLHRGPPPDALRNPVAHGITISVDAETATGFVVTISTRPQP